MQLYQRSISDVGEFDTSDIGFIPDLILLFVGSEFEHLDDFISRLSTQYPRAILTGCSTAGEISNLSVSNGTISMSAVKFEKSSVQLSKVAIKSLDHSREAGSSLGQIIDKDSLKHVFVLSDGLNVNGAELVEGLMETLPKGVTVTGGLAGDGTNFDKTFIIDNAIEEHKIIALSFHGEYLKIGYGSKGGWDSFGIEREVTKSSQSILYELDGEPALDIYKKYLGDKADELPGSGVLFPLSLRSDEGIPVVRTLLGIDEDAKSITFAGSIPEGSYVRLMKANVDRLINGAAESAIISKEISDGQSQLAILISCVGRKLVLKQLVEEEIEAVSESLNEDTVITGFYSYGEIGPFGEFSPCQLHNQTMTITTISEY